ncbi:MAG: hypothetical protein ABA06_02025 [Parcubacteria bacterium C7867-001]|nr:MAG: hypothetical protein ABA06_02025 [Parcubacteria bacterium C7867-001]
MKRSECSDGTLLFAITAVSEKLGYTALPRKVIAFHIYDNEDEEFCLVTQIHPKQHRLLTFSDSIRVRGRRRDTNLVLEQFCKKHDVSPELVFMRVGKSEEDLYPFWSRVRAINDYPHWETIDPWPFGITYEFDDPDSLDL